MSDFWVNPPEDEDAYQFAPRPGPPPPAAGNGEWDAMTTSEKWEGARALAVLLVIILLVGGCTVKVFQSSSAEQSYCSSAATAAENMGYNWRETYKACTRDLDRPWER